MGERFQKTAVWLVALVLVSTSCSGSSRHGATVGDGGASAGSLQVGQPAPDFTLPSVDGASVTLSMFKEHRPVLLYFSMGPG